MRIWFGSTRSMGRKLSLICRRTNLDPGERCFGRLKDFRRNATRYAKRKISFRLSALANSVVALISFPEGLRRHAAEYPILR